MAQVQEVKVINIDDVQYAVESMSEACQRLVRVYNEWNQREANIHDDLMIIQAAKETLSRQIIDQVRQEQQAAKAEAAADEATEVETPAEEAAPTSEAE